MSTCTRQTPQQQLAERRERLKRKANEDLQASMPRAFGCDTLPSSQDRKGKSREVSPSLPAFPGQGSVSDEEDVRLSTPELDLDMLLDGLEIDESIKQMAKDDPIFRADLKRQLATMQIPERWNGQADQGFDEEDIDEEADLGECDLDQTLYCKCEQLSTLRCASAYIHSKSKMDHLDHLYLLGLKMERLE